ncbi:hypothetical protein [Cupriavidus sp. CuC1]|uniref:hypothetical protein n=1 Tax=Cupriavidus sp. CuC1 TaxID=3373131 RepID=UPI0037D54C14
MALHLQSSKNPNQINTYNALSGAFREAAVVPRCCRAGLVLVLACPNVDFEYNIVKP